MAVARLRSPARALRALCAAAGLTALAAMPAGAQTQTPVAAPAPAPAPAAPRGELARIEDEIKLSDETAARLQAEIKGLDADRTRLAASLVETGTRTREAEEKAAAAEARLGVLAAQEDASKAALAARRGVLVEVIASLQRMGHHPPPALLVEPEDALKAVRTAMLLGAVLPQMRQEMQGLAADLAALSGVRASIAAERDGLRATLTGLAEDRKRIDLLVEERQRALERQERSLVAEQVHAEELARQAASLKDLIVRLERDVGAARQAAGEAAKAGTRPALAALEDPGRLSPAVAFADARGTLRLPATGTTLHRFGADDGNGGQEKGLTLAAEPDATVIAPCDGWIVYSGPFRSYGKLLIINAGGGYHIVLAGMRSIDATIGQFVLTGEPVGAMGRGETDVASAGATAPAGPSLYIEFRKDGTSIDPTPWWATQGEKARG